MRKNTLLSLLFLFVSLVFVSCSDDKSNVEMNNGDTALSLKSRSSVWSGPIAVLQNGEVVLAAQESDLLQAFNEYFKERGYVEQVQSVSLVKKVASNDSSIERYFLLGSTGDNLTANVILRQEPSTPRFYVDDSFEFVTFCEGCPSGCHVKFLKHEGKIIPYCDEGPCTIYWCEQFDEGNTLND
ncbi:hypothetical protein ABS768_07095 [Flavobacterium sp. ST-75]|uniref:Lipoprotein n=1 Tax=Flavobacterium rhizophilum TaxID=3163296 RepID=A0ABW8YDD4_9FLAO